MLSCALASPSPGKSQLIAPSRRRHIEEGAVREQIIGYQGRMAHQSSLVQLLVDVVRNHGRLRPQVWRVEDIVDLVS